MQLSRERGPLHCSRDVDQSIKVSCHQQVAVAVSLGQITRQPCEICGAEKVLAHHDDYARPLDVRWLCHRHHIAWHQAFGARRRARRGLIVKGSTAVALIRALHPGEGFQFVIENAAEVHAEMKVAIPRLIWSMGQWAAFAAAEYIRTRRDPSLPECSCCPQLTVSVLPGIAYSRKYVRLSKTMDALRDRSLGIEDDFARDALRRLVRDRAKPPAARRRTGGRDD